jgi:hypothetical protein
MVYVSPEELAQPRFSPLVVNARRPDGDTQHRGGIGDGQILVEDQMQDVALSRRQLLQSGDERSRALIANDVGQPGMLDPLGVRFGAENPNDSVARIARRRRSSLAVRRMTPNRNVRNSDCRANGARPSISLRYEVCNTSSAAVRSHRQHASAHPKACVMMSSEFVIEIGHDQR